MAWMILLFFFNFVAENFVAVFVVVRVKPFLSSGLFSYQWDSSICQLRDVFFILFLQFDFIVRTHISLSFANSAYQDQAPRI